MVLLFTLGTIIWWALKESKPVFGVYTQPTATFWLKVLTFYAIILFRRLYNRIFPANQQNPNVTAGYGVKSKTKIEHIECLQTLSTHPKAIDAVYFNAADRNGNYLVVGTARRPQGVINGLLFIRIRELGILELPKSPDTMLFGDGTGFSAESLHIEPIKPMVSWKLQYDGKMKFHGGDSMVDVKLDVLWTSNLPYFDFDTDMNTLALAKSMSTEPWSRKYFQNLKEAHQTHYEQMGKIRGTATIDGKSHELSLDSLRDHSYALKREWKLMHRYALHMIHTEDGCHINASVVCQPQTSSNLQLGYMNLPNGEIVSVSSVDFPLWQHGENGNPPTDYAFTFEAGGKKYFVEVEMIASPYFYIGWEWETKVIENFAKFRVNGVPGWGVAEWDYRHKKGRPQCYQQSDPEWTKSMAK